MFVGDDQHRGIQVAYIAIQGGEGLALFRPSDNDFSSFDITIVKGMHGLAILQHDVVGDVYNVVDGPHSGGPEAIPHPLRGRPNLNIADHSCGIPGTEICGRNFHIQQIRKIARSTAVHHRVVQGQRLAIGHRGLPGKPNHGQTIRPVGSDFKLHHVVVQPNGSADIIAWLQSLGL